MKKYLFLLILLVPLSVKAQECPADKVCISREDAQKAIVAVQENTALKEEVKAKDKAFDDLTKELNKMRIEFAEKSGENTALKQNAVADRAIIELLLKNTKKKCLPLSICL